MTQNPFDPPQEFKYAGNTDEVPLRLRIDTPIEVDCYQQGGILPYVLRELLAAA
jgi:aconitase A